MTRPKVPRSGEGKKLEIRQQGKHYTIVDTTGRVYARENNRRDAERTWRRHLTGLSKELGNKRGPMRFKKDLVGAGKGDGRRPQFVSDEELAARWREIFGQGAG